MENSKDIIKYDEQFQPLIDQFSKRLPIQQFKQIDHKRMQQEFGVLRAGFTANYKEVIHIEGQGRDRYSDIHTYKHNRIQVDNLKGFYLNASLMRSVIDKEVFAVFAQAPVKKVIEHFWYACYHHNIRKIVMLCALEDPLKGIQAERYWPLPNEEVKFSNVNISVRCSKQEVLTEDKTKTTIVVNGPQGQKEIEHIHWGGWGDMKKPMGQSGEQLFRNLVNICIDSIDKKEQVMIHCSAGIGRTGTLGAVIEGIRCGRKFKELSVFEIVDNMRKQRMGCVQTPQQYAFVYQQLQQML